MSVAYYIVLDNDEPDFETFVNGKAVAHAADEIDQLCDQHGLQRLDSFMGQSMDEFADMLDEDIELPEGEDGEAKWFKPSDGISLIDAIASAIRKQPDSVPSADAVLEDLAEYKEVLQQARDINAKWHLALDI
ncbi:hypothetical protein [Pseudoduganella violaceinigra]|uniref:hypothetical protein n=1 Tax=Pseudoduganella violaceinigra TaxID=246602 RepID=UPI000425B254|nr:hypothetical protein [Pseudoduganella violaceinigra]